MTEVLILVLKIVIIAFLSIYIGNKTGLFSLGRIPSIILMLVFAFLFSVELYSSFWRNDISLLIVFNSDFLKFTWDLSFFLRIFLASMMMGIICSCFGIRPSARINTVKELCVLAMLIALTVVLGIYATVRVGNAIKVSFKFIPVFMTAAFFGPLWGGIAAVIADVVAFAIAPVGGVFLPQITMVEFLYGFTFGLFFFGSSNSQGYSTIIKIVICVIFQIVILNLGLTSYFLIPIMNIGFREIVALRSISALITMAIELVVLIFMTKYMSTFKRLLR